MSKHEFKNIRPALAKHDYESLLALVIELYKLNSTNRDYLHARFDSSQPVIRKFKKKIADLVYPETYCETDRIAFGEARRQINAFKKATGNREAVVELYVYGMECAFEAAEDFEDLNRESFTTMLKFFEHTCDAVLEFGKDENSDYVARLKTLVSDTRHIKFNFDWQFRSTFEFKFPDERLSEEGEDTKESDTE